MHLKRLNVLFLIIPPKEKGKRQTLLLFFCGTSYGIETAHHQWKSLPQHHETSRRDKEMWSLPRGPFWNSSTLSLPSPAAAPICDLFLHPPPGALVIPGKQMKGSAIQLCTVPQVTQCQRDSKTVLWVCWGVLLTVGRRESTEPMLGAHYVTVQPRMCPSVCGKAGSETLSAIFLPVGQANATGIVFSWIENMVKLVLIN